MDRTMSGLTRRSALALGGSAVLMTAAQARAQGIQPKRGGRLTTVLNPEPPILILGVNNQAPTITAATKFFQGLVRISRKVEPLPELAKSWTLSDDKRTYTFHLEENVLWHDGKPFTADDVIFSVMKFNMELAPRARSVFTRIKEATAHDPHTVSFTLDAPFEPFLLMFEASSCPMVAKHIYDGTDYRNNPANQKPIGTGPFVFTEWQRGNFIRLRRNEHYWRPGRPYLDEILYRIVPDSQSRSLALQTGQIQMTQSNDIEPFDVPQFRAMPNIDVETAGWEFYSPVMWLELNNRVKPLDDVRVRQAISHAVDRKFILQHLWFNVGKVATGPVASTTRFYDPSSKLQDYDPHKAAALLDAAGLKPNGDGVRFSLRHLVLPYGEVWSRLSEYLRASLGKVGIRLELENTDPGGWVSRVGSWNYDTTINYLYQYGDPTLGVERSYVSTNIKKVTFTNTEGYANPKVDALFATARNSGDPAERRKALYAVQKILETDVPVVWLLEMSFPTIHDKRLHNTVELGTGPNSSYDDVFLS